MAGRPLRRMKNPMGLAARLRDEADFGHRPHFDYAQRQAYKAQRDAVAQAIRACANEVRALARIVNHSVRDGWALHAALQHLDEAQKEVRKTELE